MVRATNPITEKIFPRAKTCPAAFHALPLPVELLVSLSRSYEPQPHIPTPNGT